MNEVTAWRTSDGKYWEDQNRAEQHQDRLDFMYLATTSVEGEATVEDIKAFERVFMTKNIMEIFERIRHAVDIGSLAARGLPSFYEIRFAIELGSEEEQMAMEYLLVQFRLRYNRQTRQIDLLDEQL